MRPVISLRGEVIALGPVFAFGTFWISLLMRWNPLLRDSEGIEVLMDPRRGQRAAHAGPRNRAGDIAERNPTDGTRY